MAKVNTLFRKVYLLAGVMMAANMFAVNEVKASDGDRMMSESDKMLYNNYKKKPNTNIYEKPNVIPTEEETITDKKNKKKSLVKLIRKLPDNQNIYTFFAGLFFSIVNNYSKWWDYNPGTYWEFGCLGWRSKSFLKDILQFDINLNVGRGAFWTFLICLNSYSMLNTVKGKNEASFTDTETPPTTPIVFRAVARSIEGFISIPLAIHIQGFDISIALDSILFGLVVNHFVLPLLSRPFVYDYNGIDDVISRSSLSGDHNGINNIKGEGKPVKIYNN